MVQLEEVKDAELNAPQPGPASDEFEDDADFTDTGRHPAPPQPAILISLFFLRFSIPAPLLALALRPPTSANGMGK